MQFPMAKQNLIKISFFYKSVFLSVGVTAYIHMIGGFGPENYLI